MTPFKPIPDGLIEDTKRLPKIEIERKYGIPNCRLDRIYRRFGLVAVKAKPKLRDVPEDWVEQAPRNSVHKLKGIYRCSEGTINRWADQTGVKPLKTSVGFTVQHKPSAIPAREDGRAADAQLILQRKFPVFRQRIVNPHAPADMWVVAGKSMHESDMIAMAERYA